MRKSILLIFILMLCGCGKNILGPQILYLSFNNTVTELNTWAKVLEWNNAQFASWVGPGGGWQDGAYPGDKTDNAYSLAHYFWLKNAGGKNTGVGGVCGNFAGFMIYCMRMHGHKTGGVVYYFPEGGHIESWTVNDDGSVNTTSNGGYTFKAFPNIMEYKKTYDYMLSSGAVSQLYYVNDHCNSMTQEELNETFK